MSQDHNTEWRADDFKPQADVTPRKPWDVLRDAADILRGQGRTSVGVQVLEVAWFMELAATTKAGKV